MRERAQRLYARARECRVVAETARDAASRKMLLQTADKFEAEARKMEEETPKQSSRHFARPQRRG
jgi:hypothetical protein